MQRQREHRCVKEMRGVICRGRGNTGVLKRWEVCHSPEARGNTGVLTTLRWEVYFRGRGEHRCVKEMRWLCQSCIESINMCLTHSHTHTHVRTHTRAPPPPHPQKNEQQKREKHRHAPKHTYTDTPKERNTDPPPPPSHPIHTER